MVRVIDLRKSFTIGGLDYEISVTNDGIFSFELVGGNSPKGSTYNRKRDLYNLFPDVPIYEDVDLNFNAMPVYRKAGEILLEWLYTKKPWRIGFAASTDRKVKIYRWMAGRLARKLVGYSLVEHPPGVFNFYRIDTDAEDSYVFPT